MSGNVVHPLSVALKDREAAWQTYRDARADDQWYRIETKAGKPKTADVYLFDEIGFFGVSASQFVREIRGLKVDTINLHVNSPGGDYPDSAAIMNSLRAHEARVVATVDGIAASGASIVVLGADEVVMNNGSEMMIHDPIGIVLGNAAEMAEAVALLNKLGDTIAGLYQGKAGGDIADWRAAMLAETWYTGQEAVDVGLADRLDSESSAPEVVSAKAKFDLTVYNFAGRDKAPAPRTRPADGPGDDGGNDMAKLNEGLVAWAKTLGIDGPDKLPDDAALQAAIQAKLEAGPPQLNEALVTWAKSLGVTDPEKLADDAALQAAIKVKLEKKSDTPPADDKPGDKPASMAGLPEGAVVVDRATLDMLQAASKRADAVVEKMNAKERDDAIAQAIKDGKLPKVSENAWKVSWDKDPVGTKAQIDKMPKNLVPVDPVGDDRYEEADADYAALYPQEVNTNG